MVFCYQGFATKKGIAGLDEQKKKEMVVQGLAAGGAKALNPDDLMRMPLDEPVPTAHICLYGRWDFSCVPVVRITSPPRLAHACLPLVYAGGRQKLAVVAPAASARGSASRRGPS